MKQFVFSNLVEAIFFLRHECSSEQKIKRPPNYNLRRHVVSLDNNREAEIIVNMLAMKYLENPV